MSKLKIHKNKQNRKNKHPEKYTAQFIVSGFMEGDKFAFMVIDANLKDKKVRERLSSQMIVASHTLAGVISGFAEIAETALSDYKESIYKQGFSGTITAEITLDKGGVADIMTQANNDITDLIVTTVFSPSLEEIKEAETQNNNPSETV